MLEPKAIGPACTDNDREHLAVPATTAHATPAALALHNNFRSAVRSLQRDLVRSTAYLVAIRDRKVHRALGYASIIDYAAAVAGFSRSQTETLLALGRRLDHYPQVRRALTEGTLSWSKARIIVERANPQEEVHWLEAATRLSVREIAVAISESARGERATELPPTEVPNSAAGSRAVAPDPAPAPPAAAPAPATVPLPDPQQARGFAKTMPQGAPCHVTYAFTPEEYALWGAAQEILRKGGHRESNTQLLVTALSELAQGHAAPPSQAGGPRYLLQIQLCPTCGEAVIITRRGRHAAPPALLAVSQCDALVEDETHRRSSVISPRLRREVLKRDGHRCQAPRCGHTAFLEIHHRIPLAVGGRTTAENLVALCAHCHRELHRREADLRQSGQDPVSE